MLHSVHFLGLILLLIVITFASNTDANENKLSVVNVDIGTKFDSEEGTLHITFPIDNQIGKTFDSKLTVEILDVEDKILAKSTQKQKLNKGKNEMEITLHIDLTPKELAIHRLHYELNGGGEKVDDIISLFGVLGQLETHILTQNGYYSGSNTSLRIVLLQHNNQKPITDGTISVELKQAGSIFAQYKVKPDKYGTLEASLLIPNYINGEANLSIRAITPEGEDYIEQSVQIRRAYQIMLTTDKPLYQPGQLIHIRTLTLQKPNLRPVAEKKVIIEVEDSKGNKVYKQKGETDKFGIAALDFQLASEINMGSYKIRAI